MALPMLLFCIALCLLLLYLYRFSKQRHPNFPPGPPRLPVWGGYWFVLYQSFRFHHKAFHKLCQKYKTKILGLYMGPYATVVVSDPKYIHEVLVRPEFQGRLPLFLTNVRTYNKTLGIFFTDGPFWEQQRRFALRHLRDYGFGRRFSLLECVGHEEIQDMLDLLHGRREDKEIFSNGLTLVPDLFHTVFFNAMWFMITGQRFPVKEHQKLRYFTRQAMRFQKSIEVTGNAVAQTPWLRHFAPYHTGFTDLYESTVNMLKYMEEAVQEHKTSYCESYMRDFIDRYLQKLKNCNKTQAICSFTEEQLQVVGVDFLFPTSTTVTATLHFVIAFLLKHPEVQAKMHQELDKVVGRDRLPTLDDRCSLPYNEAVLREVMRRETLVPLAAVHRATEDSELGGYNIPKNTAMIVNLWSYHNDPDVWGDPQVFRPERFLDENGQLLKKDLSLPFATGKRMCVGETFSRHFMFLVLATILQSFTVKLAPGMSPPCTEADLPGIIVTKKEMWVKFEPRS